MARIEQDREDLLAEATALVARVELELPAEDEHTIIGFRSTGCGSVYLGPDEAYQFNTAGELRRAYRDGHLYKAERGRLVRLTRRRTHDEVQLIRHDLNETEAAAFLSRMAERLGGLTAALAEQRYHVVGQVPDGTEVVGRAAAWLIALPRGEVAHSPHAR